MRTPLHILALRQGHAQRPDEAFEKINRTHGGEAFSGTESTNDWLFSIT